MSMNVPTTLNDFARQIHLNAVNKGFWDEPRNDGEIIALIHSECSELLEAIREGNPQSDHIPMHSLAAEECADIIIRILDYAFTRGWNIDSALVAKMEFNTQRPRKHGKAF